LQGVILGAYFYSYTLTQVFGGRFTERFGARWVCGIGIFVPAIANALTPIAANTHESLIIIVRIIIGAFHGLIYSSLYSMYAQWFPKNERTTAIASTAFGGNIGSVITTPLAGYLSRLDYQIGEVQLGGWPMVFYLTSAIHLIWFALWCWLVYDTPEKDPHISTDEKIYIWQNIGYNHERSESEVVRRMTAKLENANDKNNNVS